MTPPCPTHRKHWCVKMQTPAHLNTHKHTNSCTDTQSIDTDKAIALHLWCHRQTVNSDTIQTSPSLSHSLFSLYDLCICSRHWSQLLFCLYVLPCRHAQFTMKKKMILLKLSATSSCVSLSFYKPLQQCWVIHLRKHVLWTNTFHQQPWHFAPGVSFNTST